MINVYHYPGEGYGNQLHSYKMNTVKIGFEK